MIRVRFLKSCASTSTSYGKNAVAWLGKDEAKSFINAGLCVIEDEQEESPKVIVQEIKPKSKKAK